MADITIPCPLDGCDWTLDEPAPAVPEGTLAEVFGPGVVSTLARNRHAQHVEDALRAHYRTHSVPDFLRTISLAASDLLMLKARNQRQAERIQALEAEWGQLGDERDQALRERDEVVRQLTTAQSPKHDGCRAEAAAITADRESAVDTAQQLRLQLGVLRREGQTLVAERSALLAAIERVRTLHAERPAGWCWACTGRSAEPVLWPCRTLRALDGTEATAEVPYVLGDQQLGTWPAVATKDLAPEFATKDLAPEFVLVPRSMTAYEWNARYPAGTPVEVWPLVRTGVGFTTRTRSAAWALGHGSPVVLVEGLSGGIALTHVQPISEEVAGG